MLVVELDAEESNLVGSGFHESAGGGNNVCGGTEGENRGTSWRV